MNTSLDEWPSKESMPFSYLDNTIFSPSKIKLVVENCEIFGNKNWDWFEFVWSNLKQWPEMAILAFNWALLKPLLIKLFIYWSLIIFFNFIIFLFDK